MDSTQTFTAGQVEALTDINPETLRVWRRRGFADASKTGGWSRYSLSDVVTIATVLDVTSFFKMDVSAVHDFFAKGAAGFHIVDAINAAIAGAADVWLFVITGNVDEHGGRSWTVTATDAPATIFGSMTTPRSALGVNVSDVARKVFARVETLGAGNGDD